MNITERRTATRLSLRIPLRFRSLSNSTSPEQRAETVNISQRGVFFTTAFPLTKGTPIEMLLKMPSELTGKAPAEVRCTAHVIHVQPDRSGDGKAGVGVVIERYQTLGAVERRAGPVERQI